MSLRVELEKGPYLVYEQTGHSAPGDSWGMRPGRALTVHPGDVSVTATDGTHVPVGPITGLTETITRGSLQYTGAARFDVLRHGTYVVDVTTPHTRVIVAPSITSGFRGTLKWIALGGLSGVLFLIGVVLLIVGIVKSRRSPATATPAGWYQDPQGHASWRWWDGNAWTDRTG
jgi:hypothetical protein